MYMQTGSELTKDVQLIEGDTIRFMAEDDHEMFEIRILNDGRTIEIMGVGYYIVDGVLYTEKLKINPRSSNLIDISTERLD